MFLKRNAANSLQSRRPGKSFPIVESANSNKIQCSMLQEMVQELLPTRSTVNRRLTDTPEGERVAEATPCACGGNVIIYSARPEFPSRFIQTELDLLARRASP